MLLGRAIHRPAWAANLLQYLLARIGSGMNVRQDGLLSYLTHRLRALTNVLTAHHWQGNGEMLHGRPTCATLFPSQGRSGGFQGIFRVSSGHWSSPKSRCRFLARPPGGEPPGSASKALRADLSPEGASLLSRRLERSGASGGRARAMAEATFSTQFGLLNVPWIPDGNRKEEGGLWSSRS